MLPDDNIAVHPDDDAVLSNDNAVLPNEDAVLLNDNVELPDDDAMIDPFLPDDNPVF